MINLDDFLDGEEHDDDCERADCPLACRLFAAAEAALPQQFQLFYLEQGDKLSDQQVESIILDDIAKVEEEIDSWYRDNDHYAINYEIETVLDDDARVFLERHKGEFSTLLDDLQDVVRERDTSSPLTELAGAAHDVWLQFWICDVRDEATDDPQMLEIEVEKICQLAMLDHSNKPALRAAIKADIYGDVHLLLLCDVQELIEKIFGPHAWSSLPADPKLITSDAHLSIDGYLVPFDGSASITLDMANGPWLNNDVWIDGWSADHFEVKSRLDEYVDGLVAFNEYRNRLMERT